MSFVSSVGGLERSGAEAQTFAHQGFGLLWRARFGNGYVTSAKAVGMQISQSRGRQFRATHGNKSVAARLLSSRIEHQLDFGDGAHL